MRTWIGGTAVMAAATLALSAGVVFAEDERSGFDFGGDAYRAGGIVALAQDEFEGADHEGAFMAGRVVRLDQAISGSAHLAGQRVEVEAPVGGDLYAVGEAVEILAPVEGQASLFGRRVEVGAPIAGNLRTAASEIDLDAPVAGSALVAGKVVRLSAPIEGDLSLAAGLVDFGSGARVGGTLTLFEEEGALLEVPSWVVSADRLERRPSEHWESLHADVTYEKERDRGFGGFGSTLMAVFLLTLAAVVLAPQRMLGLRDRLVDEPGRALVAGLASQSALIGGGIVLALTVIGALLTPFAWLAAILLGIFGMLVSVFSLGTSLLALLGQDQGEGRGESFGARVLAALTGSVLVCLLAQVPYLGWLVTIALVLAGIGATSLVLLRPRFFGEG